MDTRTTRAISLGRFDPDQLARQIVKPAYALPATPLQKAAWEVRQALMRHPEGAAFLQSLSRSLEAAEAARHLIPAMASKITELDQKLVSQGAQGLKTINANAEARRAEIRKKFAAEIKRRKRSGESLKNSEVCKVLAKELGYDYRTVARAMGSK
jgi:hypothetical protein